MAEQKVRASLIEMFRRFIPLMTKDKAEHVYWNGEDNLYPNEIETVIINSPTAKRAAKLMSKYIGGAGVLDASTEQLARYADLPYVNEKKGYKITDIIRIASENIAYQYGVFFHVQYGVNENGELYQKSLDVLEYNKCRLGKEDDEENAGKIFYHDFSAKEKFGGKKKEKAWFYPYNPNKDVVIAQIKADAKKSNATDLAQAIKSYKGQVFYLNLSPQFKYALSPFDAVYNDCDTEYRMGLYRNTETRSGFMGKVLVLTQGLDEESEKKINNDLSEWMGSESGNSMMRVNLDSTDDLSKVMIVQQFKPQYDDKLFVETTKTINKNILGQANSIPEPMVSASDSALFGTSSDTYREMKLFYSEQTEEEREKLQETLTYLGFPVIIEPIVKVESAATSDKQADAQAELKGSVGGVTALLELQKSVSEGFTSEGAAVAIIETIYGIDTETALKMVGKPIDAPITEEKPTTDV